MEHCRICGKLSVYSLPALRKCSLKAEIGEGFTSGRFESLELRDLPALEVSLLTCALRTPRPLVHSKACCLWQLVCALYRQMCFSLCDCLNRNCYRLEQARCVLICRSLTFLNVLVKNSSSLCQTWRRVTRAQLPSFWQKAARLCLPFMHAVVHVA